MNHLSELISRLILLFLSMSFTEIHKPLVIEPEMLDKYLDHAWFRMGQMIFTCHFLCFKSILYPSIWTRLTLPGFTFSKSNRKLIRRNSSRFSHRIGPAVFNPEKEELYQRHITRFQGYIAPTLRESLFGESKSNIYNTYEIEIYDEGKLVAASFFDLGKKSMASIMGLFDPAYAQHSLGYYTMLCEINYGLENGIDFYYPGYVVPGYGKFDYKLRIGNVDFYEPTSRKWISYKEHFNIDDTLTTRLHQALDDIQKTLQDAGFYVQKTLYPLYDKKLYGLESEETIYNPLFLKCVSDEEGINMLIVEYDVFKGMYRLCEVFRIDDASLTIHKMFEGFDLKTSCLNFLIREQTLKVSDNKDDIVSTLEWVIQQMK